MRAKTAAAVAAAERRRAANHASRNQADHDGEPWSDNELEILLNFWNDGVTGAADVAETLGRTIEACRERYLKATKQDAPEARVQKTLRAASAWDKGFTSLDDMGY
jgi:hypothetical protein